MARGVDIRFITGCLPVIAFLALSGWGFNHFILSPRQEAIRRKGPANAKENAARMAVRVDLKFDTRETGRIHLVGTLANASPYALKHVIVNVAYTSSGAARSTSVNLGAVDAYQTRSVATRLRSARASDVDLSAGPRVTVSDVRLME